VGDHLKGTLLWYSRSHCSWTVDFYYDETKELLYVDHFFLREGVRACKQYFDYKLLDLTKCKIIQSSLKNCFVNGLPNGDLARTIIPNRKLEQEKQLQK
jgi:hypothetical protein